MTTRYALYFAPASGHPLWAAGCDWLGRDPETGSATLRRPHRNDPRRYGLHATLKPPFALRDGFDEAALLAALAAWARERTAFEIPGLAVATLGDFIALRPVDRDAAAPGRPLRRLADDCVRRFDEFRLPLTAAEAARRVIPGLAAQQRANIEHWGYPHVFDQWRFHMTLSDSLPLAADADRVVAGLLADATHHFAAALAEPLRCDGVALFVEDAPGVDFRLARRFEFAR
jgi:putative phosphonate metabolism protein